MKNRRNIAPSIAGLVALALIPSSTLLFAETTAASPSESAGAATSDGSSTVAPKKAAAPTASMPYTVVSGDSFTKLAEKFNTTRRKLKALNSTLGDKLVDGEVIQVPASHKALAAAAKKAHQARLAAQPVQDFDIPASTFASCPVPEPPDESETSPTADGKPAPVAQLVSPAEMSADQASQNKASAASQVRLSADVPPPHLALPPEKSAPSSRRSAWAAKLPSAPKTLSQPNLSAPVKPAPSGWASSRSYAYTTNGARFSSSLPAPRLTSQSEPMNTPATDPANDWGFKFLRQARSLGDLGIDYDDEWRPPGERSAWTMDCSNTTRYLYKITAGINLPRTASDQYYFLHLQGKAWDVPTGPTGWADVSFLQRNLRPGDLLFWENTYRPERQPPITHVMVFLGTNERGQWIMAGSQSSRGGEHNRRNGGPDVYVFRPSQACGGYSTWLGLHKHVGRFCAFGRPLEADPSKFAVND